MSSQAPTETAPPQTVTFKLNGKPVTVPKGWTVMQAAEREGVEIPHFCWHPGLSVAGVCRFCMVKVEGRPKMEIACNLAAIDGMDVQTETAEVKDAHKWGLEFHLINHPLDCPICDQAGECELQNSYMAVGKYHSQMTRPKVLKPKALDVGSDLILDTERCILCSRCVRFEDEVTKTGALGIFDRGDRSIIGIYPERKIEHNYTTNLVDICPVGAFTSKDFRFKQRVWFLKDKPSICPGCSTGCHVNVYGKQDTLHYYRIKPRFSDVNQHWMCDTGRHMYMHLNPEVRLNSGYAEEAGNLKAVDVDSAIHSLANKLAGVNASDIALLVAAQYTTEEYDALLHYFVKQIGVKNVFQWREPTEDLKAFDGILHRGDQNANTAGLLQTMKKYGLAAEVRNDMDAVARSNAKVVIALAPEIPQTVPSLPQQLKSLAELPYVSLWTVAGSAAKIKGFKHLLPMKGFPEKKGTFINYAGKVGALEKPFASAAKTARDVCEVMALLTKFAGKK